VRELTGTTVADRYVLERELGRGGMATVWRARDTRHERLVAIKVLHPELASAIGVDRFIREVRVTARLQHPNIVPILDSGVLKAADGTSLPWYAMAYLDGESLRARLAREQQLPIDDVLRIAESAGAALQAAHSQGIVHRDVKPENIFLSQDRIYVVDFGIAKALLDTDQGRLTSTGLTIGTPTYMSPEQAVADRVDARSDQYSLAVVTYEMLAGEPPFSGPSSQAIIARRVAEPARPLRPVRSTVSESIERAVLKALERSPADRFASVQAFTAALRSAEATPTALLRGHITRRRVVVSAAVVAIVASGSWLLAARQSRPAEKVTNPEVVQLYQRGVREYDRRTPASVVTSISNFQAAIARDSTYAPAWNALANSYVRARERLFAVPGLSGDSLLQRAVVAVDRAVDLDSTSAGAWVTKAVVSRAVDPTDLGPPIRAVRRAIQLDSTLASAWHFLALYTFESGDVEGGMKAFRHGVMVGPTYTQGLAFLALGHYWRRNFDSAAFWADSAVAVDPSYLLGRTVTGTVAIERGDFTLGAAAYEAARRLSTDVELLNALAGLALVDARAGRRARALIEVRRIDSLAATYSPIPLHTATWVAQAYAGLGNADRAVLWLRRYQPQNDLHFQLHLRCDASFDPIAKDKRFRALLVLPPGASGDGC
jgi:serine/threonine protein kinase/tetratricopeptide (TPR) repeat protein